MYTEITPLRTDCQCDTNFKSSGIIVATRVSHTSSLTVSQHKAVSLEAEEISYLTNY